MSTSYLHKFARSFLQALTFFLIIAMLGGLQSPMNAAAAPQERPRADIPPAVSLNVPTESFLGQDFTFTVQFDNTDTVTGYGPLIDLILPTNGADGNQNTNPPLDGLTFVSAAYLGADVESTALTFPGSGGVTCVDHPYMVDSTGNPVQVCGDAGDTLVALRLPFGSFTPNQPPAAISVTVSMSSLADLGTPLTIEARGGYQFGFTPLNDWCCGDDPTLSLSGWTSDSVTPIIFTLSKSYNGPEDETASGPNFPRQYTITAEIAPGQTMTSFNLTDVLPNNMQFVSLVSTSPGGASCSLPSTSTPGGTLSCNFGTVSGTVSATLEFYIPLRDSSSLSVIDPVSGDDVLSCNNASGSGNWTPSDPRDTGGVQTINRPGCEHILTDKSIAIQKGASVLGGGDPTPGKTIEYSLDIQVSDFFVFNGLVVTDTFTDGQHLDTSFTPTLQVNGNTFTLGAAAFTPANYDVACHYTGGGPECETNTGPFDGTTTLIFRLSNEIISRGQDGRLIGGCVPTTGTGGGDPNCDVGSGGYDDGPTTARITFRTIVLQNFVDTFPSGDSSVDQGDAFYNDVSVAGNLLSTSNATTPTGQSEADDSSASASIGRGDLDKAIYALNGSTSFSTPLEIKPGDTLTYRLTYTLPTGDVEDLRIEDFLPLPVFHVDDPDENEVAGPAWVFDDVISGVAPATGHAQFGPADTFRAYSGIIPALTSNTLNNRLDFTYGDFDGLTEQTYTIDILFTVTVSDDPFADRLYLTNQAHAYEGSTNAGDADTNDIVQIILTEPVLVHKKGAVATTNPNAVFDPATVGPVAFNAPGTVGARWAGIITSPGLAANPIDSNISGVDAGDLVTFAIVIENLGSSAKGAFDITITDTIPSIYQIPAGGLNLRIANGDNSSTFTYTRPDNSPAVDTDLFGGGIRIVDPDPNNGACQSHTVGGGKNIIVITYDLEVRPDVTPGTEENTATLTNYAGTEGGDNHIPPAPPTDTASTTVVAGLAKELVATEINNVNNDDTEVVIGEIVTYRLTSTVPEGNVPGAFVTDHLDSGLAFLSCTSVTTSSTDVTTDLPGETIEFDSVCATTEASGVTNNGQDIRFDLGNITNANRDDATPETITIVYQVVVLNVIGNQGGTLLDNAAEFYMNDGGGDTFLDNASAPEVLVIEPVVTTDKTASPDTTDAGNTVTFQVTFSNTSEAEAFDITWSDTVPAEMTYVTGSLVAGACPATTFTVSEATAPTLTGYISDLDVGETCTLTFDADVLYSVTPGYVITNSVETRWTSLPGVVANRSTYNTESDERTGEDGFPGPGVVDDYRGADSATVTINQIAPDKYLVSTSEPFTGFVSGYDRVTIGEIVRYRLVIRIPEGTSPNFQVRDNLPAGLLFLNDDTSYAFFVSNGGITSTGIDIVPGIGDPDCQVAGSSADATTPPLPPACAVLADNNVGSSASTTTDDDSYTSGTDVYFKLGTLANNDSDSDAEYVVIEFNALVHNYFGADANDAGERLRNNFSVFIGGSQSNGNSNNVDVYVVEPLLTLVKTPAIDPTQDAGDTVTYTLTITAASGVDQATAFDLNLTDAFDAALTNLTVANVTTTQGATCVGNGGGTTAFAHNGGVFVGNNLTFTATCLDPGANIVVTITATVADTAIVPSTIPNTANLTWTSLPGLSGTTSNPTGSQVPGAPGENDGERDGSLVAPNDYVTSSSAPVLLASPAVDKRDATPLQYTIGEQVTYDIWVTLPEGVTQDLTVVDNVPSGTNSDSSTFGMRYLSYLVLTSDPSLPADYNGALPVPAFSCAGTCGTGDDMTLDFGDVTTAADNITNNNTFIVRVTLLVEDITGNQDSIPPGTDYPTSLTNTATINYGAGSGSNGAADVTIIEPRITTDKSVNPTAGVEAGDTLTYTVRFTNTGNSTAYDVTAHDDLTQGVAFSALIDCRDQGGTVVPTTVTDGGATLDFDGNPAGSWDIAPGNWIECQYTVLALPTIITDGNHINTVDADWSSLNGVQPEERVYNDTVTYNFDGTQDTDTASFATEGATIVKDDGGVTQVVIGNTIHITLSITAPLGTLQDAQVVDTLPAGLIYVAGSQTVSSNITPGPGASGFSVSSPNDGTVPVILTWDFGDAEVSSTPVVIEYDAVAANVVGNIDGTNLINEVHLYYTDVSGTPQDESDTDDVNIIEPVLEIAKSVSDQYPGPNQVLTFTLTVQHAASSHANAYDVLIYDDLPAELTLNPASVTVTLGGAAAGATNNSSGNRVEVLVDSLPNDGSTVTIQFQASVSASVVLNQVITNIGNVAWTSTPGPNPNERTGSGVGPNDYFTDSIIDIVVQKSLSKSIVGHNHGATLLPEVAIGEIITYQIDFNVPEGLTTGVTITDTLDLGLAYMDCVTIVTTPNITTTTPGGFAGICSSPAVSPVGDPLNLSNAGRQVVFNFGDLENTSEAVGLITIQYRVVVLDIIENQETVDLNNSVALDWSAGPLETVSPEPLVIVESDLTLDKTADVNIAVPGTIITFTLTVEHSALSTADAYDVLLEDIVPDGLDYVPGTLTYVSGIAPTTIDDTAAPTLQVIWNDFPRLPGNSVIQFQAQMENIPPGSSVSNVGRVEWSSLPGDLSLPQSVYNLYSTERRYDPLSLVDIYGVTSAFEVTVPALPSTGFAPGRITEIPIQAAEQAYSDLGSLWLEIPRLGVKMPIVGIPAKGSEWDLTWLWEQAGWLNGTAYPTTNGNSVITGHVYLPNGQPGPFIGLSRLKWGDRVVVHMNGLAYTYEIRAVERVTPNNLSAYRHEDLSWVTLVTCQGYNASTNTYAYRLIVRAVLMSIEADAGDPGSSH